MIRKGKILKICGWCGRTFLSDNDGKIKYCCEECESKREKRNGDLTVKSCKRIK